MNFSAPFDAVLQVFAALLIFITSYLGLVLRAIVFLVVAELALERTGVVRAYGAKPMIVNNATSSPAKQKVPGLDSPFRHGIAKKIS